MTNKKLTPSEILLALGKGKIIRAKIADVKYKLGSIGLISLSPNENIWRDYDGDFRSLASQDCHIYTPPEPKKKLSERFALDFGNNGGLITTVAKVYHWLKENEDE